MNKTNLPQILKWCGLLCCGFVNEKMFLIDNDYFLQNVNVFLSKQRQNKIQKKKERKNQNYLKRTEFECKNQNTNDRNFIVYVVLCWLVYI